MTSGATWLLAGLVAEYAVHVAQADHLRAEQGHLRGRELRRDPKAKNAGVSQPCSSVYPQTWSDLVLWEDQLLKDEVFQRLAELLGHPASEALPMGTGGGVKFVFGGLGLRDWRVASSFSAPFCRTRASRLHVSRYRDAETNKFPQFHSVLQQANQDFCLQRWRALLQLDSVVGFMFVCARLVFEVVLCSPYFSRLFSAPQRSEASSASWPMRRICQVAFLAMRAPGSSETFPTPKEFKIPIEAAQLPCSLHIFFANPPFVAKPARYAVRCYNLSFDPKGRAFLASQQLWPAKSEVRRIIEYRHFCRRRREMPQSSSPPSHYRIPSPSPR